MNYRVIGSSLEITPALTAYAEKQLKKTEKFAEGEVSVNVELIDHHHKKHGDKFTCKIVWEGERRNFSVEAHGEDMYKVITEAAKKLSAHLSREHEKVVHCNVK